MTFETELIKHHKLFFYNHFMVITEKIYLILSHNVRLIFDFMPILIQISMFTFDLVTQ